MYVQPPDDVIGGHTHVDICHEHPQQGLIQVGGGGDHWDPPSQNLAQLTMTSVTNAPINCMPHYPPYGQGWG